MLPIARSRLTVFSLSAHRHFAKVEWNPFYRLDRNGILGKDIDPRFICAAKNNRLVPMFERKVAPLACMDAIEGRKTPAD